MPSKNNSQAKSQTEQDMTKKLEMQESTLAAMKAQMQAQSTQMQAQSTQMQTQLQEQALLNQDESTKQREALNDLREQMSQLMLMISNKTAQQPTQAVNNPETVNLADEIQQEGVQQNKDGRKPSKAFNFSALPPLTMDAKKRDFKNWRKQWETNAVTHDLAAFSRLQQVCALLTAIGGHMARLIELNYGMTATDQNA